MRDYISSELITFDSVRATTFIILNAFVGLVSGPVLAKANPISHASHSGGTGIPATVQKGAANLGVPETLYKSVTLTLMSDTTVLAQGQQRVNHPSVEQYPWKPFKELIQFRTFDKDSVVLNAHLTVTRSGTSIQSFGAIKQKYPNAELIGFDKKSLQHKSGFGTSWYLPRLPQSGAGAVLVVMLVGAGWLLRGKPQPVFKQLA